MGSGRGKTQRVQVSTYTSVPKRRGDYLGCDTNKLEQFIKDRSLSGIKAAGYYLNQYTNPLVEDELAVIVNEYFLDLVNEKILLLPTKVDPRDFEFGVEFKKYLPGYADLGEGRITVKYQGIMAADAITSDEFNSSITMKKMETILWRCVYCVARVLEVEIRGVPIQ